MIRKLRLKAESNKKSEVIGKTTELITGLVTVVLAKKTKKAKVWEVLVWEVSWREVWVVYKA